MSPLVLSNLEKKELESFLKKNRRADLVATYLRYLELHENVSPVLHAGSKTIYMGAEEAIKALESADKLTRETEIKISYDQGAVNEQTTKVYICPYSGKVFGNNTHANPQDAIYEWVSTCPENTERVGGLRAKRFLVSEDLDIIKKYITHRKKNITKRVFSSQVSGKLFDSKENVIEEFRQHYLRPMNLFEVQEQNRFQIHPDLLQLLQVHLQEDKIAAFVESLLKHAFFKPYLNVWLEENEEEDFDADES